MNKGWIQGVVTLAGAALTVSGWYALLKKGPGPARPKGSQPDSEPAETRPDKVDESQNWRSDADSLESRIGAAMEKEPKDVGIRGKHWTTHLLMQYLKKKYSLDASEKGIRHALKELGYAWNGSQYQLARGRARTHAGKDA
jgi:transposase